MAGFKIGQILLKLFLDAGNVDWVLFQYFRLSLNLLQDTVKYILFKMYTYLPKLIIQKINTKKLDIKNFQKNK